MGFLDVDLNDVVEPTAVPADQEYKLRVVSCKMDDDKNGDPYLLPRFEVGGEPAAKEFSKFLRIPHAGLNDKQTNSAKWQLKSFSEAFEIDLAATASPDDMIGAEGWAILGLDEDPEYGEQNYVKKFITPK